LYKNITIIIRLKNIYIHQQIIIIGISYKQQQLILVMFEAVSGHWNQYLPDIQYFGYRINLSARYHLYKEENWFWEISFG